MSQIENLLNPPKTTNVRWDLPESTMQIIKGYQNQLWKAMGKKPNLEQVITHIIEYVGREACDKYFNEIEERKQREKEASKPIDSNRVLAEAMIEQREQKIKAEKAEFAKKMLD